MPAIVALQRLEEHDGCAALLPSLTS